jgi:hypothetical protein
VQVEVNMTQEIRWTNDGADGTLSIEGNPLATATFVGGSRWRATAEGGPSGGGGSLFVDEPFVGLAFFVLSLDNAGNPIATSFFPYYGTSQKQLYIPIAGEEEEVYKGRCGGSLLTRTIYVSVTVCTNGNSRFHSIVLLHTRHSDLRRILSSTWAPHARASCPASPPSPTLKTQQSSFKRG